MKRVVRLTESDLARIVKRVISEQSNAVNIPMVWELSKKLGLKYSKPMGPDQVFFHYGNKASLSKQKIWMDITNNKPMTITVQDERGVKEFPASTPIDKIVNYAKGSANYKKLTGSEPKDSIKEQDNIGKLRGNYRIRNWGHDVWHDEDDLAVNPLDIEDFEEEVEFGPDDYEKFLDYTKDIPNKWDFKDDRGYYDQHYKPGRELPLKIRKLRIK